MKKWILVVCLLFFWNISETSSYNVNLPSEHMACYFSSHSKAAKSCQEDENCPFKDFLKIPKCWGYEPNCSEEQRYSKPVCDGSSKGWSKTKEDQATTFFKQGDFGYVKERKEELHVLCSGPNLNSSFLECSKLMRFCRARNIMFDFQSLLTTPEPMRYRDDIIKEGHVGGDCKLNKERLKQEGQHKSPLQSWYAEFEHFTELSSSPTNYDVCDVIIDKPTFVMKLDATVNMYHHFCDFLNLYATLHLNDSFSRDVYILTWDTIPYHSTFAPTWRAFTEHPILSLQAYKGKKVCFKDAVFPLLPRMIFGMYYNMPLVPGCTGSSLFRAFSEHLQHRLGIAVQSPKGKARVTLITRGTQYRKILNEDELISAMELLPDFVVQKVNFNRQMPFEQQLEISYNTDILIGIHGAGLTQMLFLPIWGSVFEIYNCDDENCYSDLARLKGLNYITWKDNTKLYPEDEGHHPTMGAHAKFTNYAFDVKEFIRLVKKAAKYVKKHPQFIMNSNASKSHHHTEL